MLKKIAVPFLFLSLFGVAHADRNPYTGGYDTSDPAYNIVFDVYESSLTIPSTGEKNAFMVRAPYNMVVDSWQIVADSSGSVSVSIEKDSFANFPPSGAGDIIVGSTCTLTALQSTSGTTAAWGSNVINQGDWMIPRIISIGTIKRFELMLIGRRTS